MRLSALHRTTYVLACAGILATTMIVAAHAQRDGTPRGGPAPLIGIGLPLAGGVLAALFLARRFRRKE